MKTINLRKIKNGSADLKWRRQFIATFIKQNPNRVDVVQLIESSSTEVIKAALAQAAPNLGIQFKPALERFLMWKGPLFSHSDDRDLVIWCKSRGLSPLYAPATLRAARMWYAIPTKYSYASVWLKVLDPAYECRHMDSNAIAMSRELLSGSLTKLRADTMDQSYHQISRHVRSVLQQFISRKMRPSVLKLIVSGFSVDKCYADKIPLGSDREPWTRRKEMAVSTITKLLFDTVLAGQSVIFVQLSDDDDSEVMTLLMDIDSTLPGHMLLSYRQGPAMTNLNSSCKEIGLLDKLKGVVSACRSIPNASNRVASSDPKKGGE